MDGKSILRQQIAYLLILVADDHLGQIVNQGVADAAELDTLVDELLALVHLRLGGAVRLRPTMSESGGASIGGQREQGGFRRGLVRVRLVRWSIHQRFASGLRQLAVG